MFLCRVGARALAADAVGCGMSALISVSSFPRWDAAWVGRHGLLESASYAEELVSSWTRVLTEMILYAVDAGREHTVKASMGLVR